MWAGQSLCPHPATLRRQLMRTSLAERSLDLVVSGFLWGFRILIVAAIVIGTVATIRAGKYSSEQWIDFIILGIAQGSIYALIALGYTLVYGILRMINFAHGEIFMLGAFGSYFFADADAKSGFLDAQPFLALGIILLVAVLVSVGSALLLERVAYRPLRGAPRLVPLITAIGASLFLRNTARAFFGPGTKGFPEPEVLAGTWTILGLEVDRLQVVVFGVAALAVL